VSYDLPITIAADAALAIKEAAKWWATNRPKAPKAFVEEIFNLLPPSQELAQERAAQSSLKYDAFISLACITTCTTVSPLSPR